MKRLWFVLLWLALLTPAFAQPIQCPDRPTADSTNACANTRFVHSVAGGGGGGGGITNVGPSLLATTSILPNSPVYANGTLGVGATLTAGSNSTLTVDSTVAVLTNIVLVKDQASALQNGIYTVTTAGSGSVPWVLTRVTYFDQAGEMLAGSYTAITGGVQNLNTAWNLQTTVATVGTSPVNFILFSQFSGYWTSGGGGGGAPIAYNAGRVNIGGTFGATVPALTAAGVVHNDTSGVLSTVKDFTTNTIYAVNYGVDPTASRSTNNTALQNAINACVNFPVAGSSSCRLALPCGQIQVSTGFTISFGITIEGCGPGRNPSSGPNATDNGGTVIDQSCRSCNTFLATTGDAVIFQDFGLNGPLPNDASPPTAGSWIYIRPEVTPTTSPNQNSKIMNLKIRGGWTGITCELCGNYLFMGNFIAEFGGVGLSLFNSVTLADAGDSTIFANTIAGNFASSGSCIYLHTHAPRIQGNKLISCENGVYLETAQGLTGTLLIQGNSIEAMHTNHVRIANNGANYGNILIQNNQMQDNSSTSSFQGSIAIVQGGGYINYCLIQGNQIIGGGIGAVSGIAVNDCNYVDVAHNEIAIGTPASVGIEVGGNATNVYLKDNIVVGASTLYEINVLAQIRDTSGMDYNSRPNPAHVRDGSQIFFTGVVAVGGACAGGGGVNAMGFLSSGTWRCY